MKVTYAPRGILQIDDARITFRNFAGRADKYNRAGYRNFAIVIDSEELADDLIDRGWNVRVRPPREEGDAPFMYMPVKIKFNDRGPAAYLTTGHAKNRLDEDTISCLDEIDILGVNLDIRPFDWEVNGKTGRAAYLQAIEVFQEVDRFAARYSDEY